MGKQLIWKAMICIAIVFMACQSATQPADPWIRERTITPAQLPGRFDTTRTYVYRNPQVAAESLLAEMVKAKLPLSRAWLPVDNLCMGPIGPRFTVELKRPSARILEFGFVKGEGRLRCAREIKEYLFP